MRALEFLALVCLALAAGTPAAAQEPGPVRESAEVSLVEVPVRVIGKDGKPVRGLTAANFTVEDDGRRQEIVGFDTIDLAEKVRAGGGPVHPAARRRFLILFDFSFSQPKAIVAARRAAREFVLTGIGERDLAAVATYSVEQGVRLLVTFSSDRAQLARAIETLGLESSKGSGDPLAFAFDAVRSAPPGVPSDRGGGRADTAGLTESLKAISIANRMRTDEYTRGRVRNLFQSFRDLSRALDSVEGRKDVIYLSEGFRGRLLVGTQETEEERQYLLHGEVWRVDADRRFGSTPLRNELDDLGQIFQRSGCVIHAVDIAGIRTENDPDSDAGTFAPRDTENALFDIARSTGGEVFRNGNDLAAEMGEVVEQTSLVYVLAFRPDRSIEEGRFHELKVKAAAPGARVLARAGYYERRGFRQLSPLERRLLAADVIANEIPFDEIPARVLAVPFAGGGTEAAAVPVLLEIPGPALLSGDKGEKLALEIYAYAIDAEGRLQDFFVRTVAADLVRSRARLEAGGVRYYGELHLPPGAYRLRTLVRNSATGRMGFSMTPLDVPVFPAHQPILLPPVFLENGGDWVSVLGAGRGEGEPAPATNPFATLSGEGLTPAAVGRVAPGATSRLCLVAYHFSTGDRDELKLGSQLLAADGRPLESVKLALLGSTPSGADGRRTLQLSFAAPANLAPGRYGLRVFLQGGAGGEIRQATAPFQVP
jgi:VWFA-related protein